MKSTSVTGPGQGLSVNYHVIEACNAHCDYCFATFPHLRKNNRLSVVDQEKLIDLLIDEGVRKINFAGGEPTLVPGLGALCERIKKRSNNRCAVSIVSNGKRLRKLIEGWGRWIDWVALSLDSGDDEVNVALGRTRKGVPYAPAMLELGDVLKNHGIHLKCNTVVTKLNVNEDMSVVIAKLSPKRWKLFQVLPVIGENDHKIEDLAITQEQFQDFVQRHLSLQDEGVELVPEDNADMTNSYYMIGPDGRFFWHEGEGNSRKLKYGTPILEVGFGKALAEVRFSEEKCRNRGGVYNWLR